MANQQKTLRLAERTINCARHGETASQRINQIVDRYLELVRLDRQAVRSGFTEKEWKALRDAQVALAKESSTGTPAMAVQIGMARALEDNPALAKKVDALTAGARFVLLEILEAEAIANEGCA